MAFDRLCSREAVGMSEDEYKMMRIAGYLHDLGKMKIPDEIPDKPGRLTEAEYISALTEERPYRIRRNALHSGSYQRY